MSPNECLFNILLYHRTVKRHTEVEILAKGFTTNTMKQHAFFSTISKTRFFYQKIPDDPLLLVWRKVGS